MSQASAFSCVHILHALAFHIIILHHLLICACLIFSTYHIKRATTNPERPILHRYYTRSKAKAIAGDQAVRLERMKMAHQELQEKHAKACKDISQMMELLITLTKGK